MNELRREIEVIKRQCERDPGSRASWTMILIFLGIGLLSLLLMMATM